MIVDPGLMQHAPKRGVDNTEENEMNHTHPKIIFERYELEPIGVNGALEATNVRFFCSANCRSADQTTGLDIDTLYSDAIDGTCCDNCHTLLVPLSLEKTNEG